LGCFIQLVPPDCVREDHSGFSICAHLLNYF
jgi:hypothetical protein